MSPTTRNPPTADYVSLRDDFLPVQEAIDRVARTMNLPQLTGGSGRGWSRWRTLQVCPHSYYLKYVKKLPIPPRTGRGAFSALDVGSLVHAYLAIKYLYMMGQSKKDWPEFFKLLRGMDVDPPLIDKVEHMANGYECQYADDYLIPVGVEYHVDDRKTGNTCRYDLVARIDDPPEFYKPGWYVVEHKTTAAFTEETLDGWAMDGEILGEIAFWQRNGLNKTFGKLQGLIINLIGKQKEPQFHRTLVNPSSLRTKEHVKNLAWLGKLELQCKQTRSWPQYHAACIGRYGKCDWYSHCLAKGDK